MAEEVSGGGEEVTDVIYLEKDALLTGIAVTEEDYEIPDVGIVRLRGLTAKQGVEGLRGDDKDALGRFQRIIIMGVISPKMTDADVALLADGKIGCVQELATRIMVISGIDMKGDIDAQVKDFLEGTSSENSSSSSASRSLGGSQANLETE